jgi:hypothetical protein
LAILQKLAILRKSAIGVLAKNTYNWRFAKISVFAKLLFLQKLAFYAKIGVFCKRKIVKKDFCEIRFLRI